MFFRRHISYKDDLLRRSGYASMVTGLSMVLFYLVKIFVLGYTPTMMIVVPMVILVAVMFPFLSYIIFAGVSLYQKKVTFPPRFRQALDVIVFIAIGLLFAHIIHKVFWHQGDYPIFLSTGLVAAMTALILVHWPTSRKNAHDSQGEGS